MKPIRPEGLARVAPATTEEFTETRWGLSRLAHPLWGWDPYEVWRTRVKGPSTVSQEREPRPVALAAEAQVARAATRSIYLTQWFDAAGADRFPS
jgi:hypothetical protein